MSVLKDEIKDYENLLARRNACLADFVNKYKQTLSQNRSSSAKEEQRISEIVKRSQRNDKSIFDLIELLTEIDQLTEELK